MAKGGILANLCGFNSMVAPLRRVLLCTPGAAGWRAADRVSRWKELGFLHAPVEDQAMREHEALCAVLAAAGVELFFLAETADLSLDAVYAHDASLMTRWGAICLRMGKAARAAENSRHRRFYEAAGIPILGEIQSPGTAEAGDIVWLDDKTLLAGRGFRTNAAGIDQIRALLSPGGATVISVPLPHGSGPDTCLHLMSLMSMIDEHTALVDLPWLAVETIELLQDRGLRLVEIDYSERESLGCNVLALGRGKLIALEQNPKTNRRLQDLGFQVQTISGIEIAINGGGGPTCLTRPLLRSR